MKKNDKIKLFYFLSLLEILLIFLGGFKPGQYSEYVFLFFIGFFLISILTLFIPEPPITRGDVKKIKMGTYYD